jgi:hypothetical protein
VKGIFEYLLRAPLKVDTYNYVPTLITEPFSFIGSLVVTSKSSYALSKGQKQTKKMSTWSMITLNYVHTFFGVRLFDTPQILLSIIIVQFLPFGGDVRISFLAFSLLKRQKQRKKKESLFIVGYFEFILCFFNFFHLLH